MTITSEELKKLLLDFDVIPIAKFTEAEEFAKQQDISLSEALLRQDLIKDEQLGRLIADYMQIPFVFLSKVSIPNDVLRIVPEVVARKQKVIVFAHDKDGLKIAMNDPGNAEIIEFISRKTGEKVNVFFASERDINDTLRFYQNEIQKTFDELIKEQITIADNVPNKEAPIYKMVDLIMQYAYQNKTSDIHIEPNDEEHSIVRFRIDGVLHDVLKFPQSLHEQIITRIKILSKLRIDDHQRAQDSKFQIDLDGENLDVRVSIVPVVGGEKAVLRLLSSRSRQFSLSDLGVSDADMQKITKGFSNPFGMVLSTGPTGSGKTTTIYAILKILNSREKNIATIEDPVEYEIAGVNQIQVNPKTNLTFADGLRSILRQDPNIIFVGEIRDSETADIAINSALTGHLVLSTLHTNDAATTLPRLIDMHIEPFLVASTVNVIVAQRLVRKICESCRITEMVPVEKLQPFLSPELYKTHFGTKKEVRIYKGKGCDVCHHTGYVGRIGLFEILEVTDGVKRLIVAKADADQIKKQAVSEGMITMIEDGLIKIESGLTTIEEVLRVTRG